MWGPNITAAAAGTTGTSMLGRKEPHYEDIRQSFNSCDTDRALKQHSDLGILTNHDLFRSLDQHLYSLSILDVFKSLHSIIKADFLRDQLLHINFTART